MVLTSHLIADSGKKLLSPKLTAKQILLSKLSANINNSGDITFGGITVNPELKEISFKAKLNLVSTRMNLEVLICTQNGRTHETLLTTNIDPFNLQIALILIGSKNGQRLQDNSGRLQGDIIHIDIIPFSKSNKKRVPIESWLFNYKTMKQMKRTGWVFVGSSYNANSCLASKDGNIVNIWSYGNTILDNPASTGDQDDNICVYTEQILEKKLNGNNISTVNRNIEVKVFMTIKSIIIEESNKNNK